ncbi:MAG: hypothetical protein NTV69_17680 [Caldilinea sp.]|nr:hypothetical protein [Chloroflexota bacterium]MCX6042951.1 hypothetical protein [Caldilinea sp.]
MTKSIQTHDLGRHGVGCRRWALWWTLGAVLLLAGCGEPERPAPLPTPPATPTSSVDRAAPLPVETLPVRVALPVQPTGLLATPTVSVLAVDQEGSLCDLDYDLDLAGYPDLYRTLGCPVAGSSSAPVAINEFGKGPSYDRFMLWVSERRQIYVLLADRSWQAYRDSWEEGQPELSCNPLEVSPSSPPLPRRGFGQLWCSVAGLQQALGVIEREERLCQHAVMQPFERGELLACFEDATIRYFTLFSEGTWQLLTVQ